MATRKNLTPDERDRVIALLRDVQAELRRIRAALQSRIDRGPESQRP
jgi:hypothetical protein